MVVGEKSVSDFFSVIRKASQFHSVDRSTPSRKVAGTLARRRMPERRKDLLPLVAGVNTKIQALQSVLGRHCEVPGVVEGEVDDGADLVTHRRLGRGAMPSPAS